MAQNTSKNPYQKEMIHSKTADKELSSFFIKTPNATAKATAAKSHTSLAKNETM